MKRLCSLFLVLCGVLILSPRDAFPSQVKDKFIAGEIVDLTTRLPISNVFVTLVSNEGKEVGYLMSDSLGGFSFRGIRATQFKLKTYRFGYVDIQTGFFDVSQQDTFLMVIQLEAEPIEMEGVEITADKNEYYLKSVGFYRRVKQGLGHFFTKKDIEKKSFAHVGDILRTVPGVHVSGRGVNKPIYFNRYLHNDRPPIMVVDGNIINRSFQGYLDTLDPDHIAGIEIYKSGIDAPGEYGGGWRSGGMILIWTRRQ